MTGCDKICTLCGSTKSYKFSRLKDRNGNWDGKSYKCETCRCLLKNYGTIDKEKIKQMQGRYKYAKHKSSIKDRICCICGMKDTFIRENGKEDWYREYVNGNWSGKWKCSKCYCKEYQERPNSQHNIFKSLAKGRLGELSIDSGLGIIGEAIVAKVRNVEIICIKLDKFNTKFDLSRDKDFGLVEVKIRNIIDIFSNGKLYEGWILHFENNIFDYLFVLCINKDRKNIERVYIMPKKELLYISSITIYKAYKSKWEEFRIDENTKNIYDKSYQDLILFLGSKRYFGIEDIKKWMKS